MKFRTTQKAINNGYCNCICVSYCALQHLLQGVEPVAYTTSVNGWAADIYEITPATAIITGYRPFGNIKPDRETIRKYDHASMMLNNNITITPTEKRERNKKLLEDFIQEVTKK